MYFFVYGKGMSCARRISILDLRKVNTSPLRKQKTETLPPLTECTRRVLELVFPLRLVYLTPKSCRRHMGTLGRLVMLEVLRGVASSTFRRGYVKNG